MAPQNDHDYFIARAAHARQMAEKAHDLGTRSVHEELARRYEERAGLGRLEEAA